LEGFKISSPVSERVLGQLYGFLFDPFGDMPVLADTALSAAVLTLKDIVEMEHLTSLEGLEAFFDGEDRAIDGWMVEIIEETDRAQAAADLLSCSLDCEDSGPVLGAVAVRPALSRIVVSSDQFKHDIFVEYFDRHRAAIYGYFSRKLAEETGAATADDLVQEVALNVWQWFRRTRADKAALERYFRH